MQAYQPAKRPLAPFGSRAHRDHPLVLATAALGFVVILFGAQVANFHAGLLCLGFPLCNGSALPPRNALAALPWVHRALAFALLAALIALALRLNRRSDRSSQPLRRWIAIVLGTTVVQIGVAAAMVLELLPPSLRAAHLLIGTMVWAGMVVLLFYSRRTVSAEPELHISRRQ